jgi:hypothetical protein
MKLRASRAKNVLDPCLEPKTISIEPSRVDAQTASRREQQVRSAGGRDEQRRRLVPGEFCPIR